MLYFGSFSTGQYEVVYFYVLYPCFVTECINLALLLTDRPPSYHPILIISTLFVRPHVPSSIAP